MTIRSHWITADRDFQHKIIFIEDMCNLTGGMSITNDAEDVLKYWHESLGSDWRVVYKDTDGEWWEIVGGTGGTTSWMGTSISFRPWHGLEWDILKR